MMSTELAFQDFLRTRSAVQVSLERHYVAPDELQARRYQEETDLLAAAMRTGDRVRLEAAVYAMGMAA